MSDQAVLEANDAFYRAFNQKDFEAMDRLWAQRVPVACIHPGWNILRGREAVMQSWQAILGNPGQARIVNGGSEAHLVDDFAYVTCRELVAGSPLAATNLFVIEDGEWRMVHHHSSPVAAA